MKKLITILFLLEMHTRLVSAMPIQINPINPITPVSNTDHPELEVYNLSFGGNNCPNVNPVVINEKNIFEFKFPNIAIKKSQTYFVSCNYRLAIKPSDKNQKFRINSANFSASSSKFSRNSTVEISMNSGDERKTFKLPPNSKYYTMGFKSDCLNTSILGVGINIVSRNDIVTLNNSSINLSIEECSF